MSRVGELEERSPDTCRRDPTNRVELIVLNFSLVEIAFQWVMTPAENGRNTTDDPFRAVSRSHFTGSTWSASGGVGLLIFGNPADSRQVRRGHQSPRERPGSPLFEGGKGPWESNS